MQHPCTPHLKTPMCLFLCWAPFAYVLRACLRAVPDGRACQSLRSGCARGAQLLRSLEAFKHAVLLCDMGARGWRILYANEPWSKATGAPRACRV